MPYLERNPSFRSVIVLVLLFGALYLPNLATRELRLSEALYGTLAEEMVRDRAMWVTQVHGDPVEKYPLYPWLVTAFRAVGAEDEWAVRLPAVASIAVMALLSGIVGYRYGGPLAGVVAAGMIVTNVACLRVGRRAQSETVLACLLTAAWLVWYVIGQGRKKWTLAWLCALTFVLLATWTAGARAIAYFYLPFLFLRRPVKGRRRLTLPSHLVPLGLFIGAILIWLHHVPGQAFFPWNELRTIPQVTLSYPLDLILFPLKCAIYLFPWVFLIWPPFCMAYRPLEHSPVSFHFLRTIVLSASIAAWLMPHVSPLALLPILPALAIMTGFHAEILLRRHIVQLRQLPASLAAAGLAVSSAGLLVALLHISGIVDIQDLPDNVIPFNSAVLAAAAITAAMILRGPLRRQPFRVQLFLAFTTIGLAVISLHDPWLAWSGNERKVAGNVLAGRRQAPPYLLAEWNEESEAAQLAATPEAAAREEQTTPEETGPDIDQETPKPTYRPLSASVVFQTTRSYYVVSCFYMGQPVIRIDDAREDMPLPEPSDANPQQNLLTPAAVQTEGPTADSAGPVVDAVYALSANGPPILPEVKWEPLTPPLNLRGRKTVRASWFPGGLCLVRLRAVGSRDAMPSRGEPVQIFRGVRR